MDGEIHGDGVEMPIGMIHSIILTDHGVTGEILTTMDSIIDLIMDGAAAGIAIT
jgi:hypothetical protein